MQKDNKVLGDGIPLGFGMALAQNNDAYQQFSNMTPEQRQTIIDGVKGIKSKEEMRAYVSQIGKGAFQ